MSTPPERSHPAAQAGPTRRQVLRTAAWSAPVVAVAVATPLASASNGQLPGDYVVTATITGVYSAGATTGGSAWINAGAVELRGVPGDTSGTLESIINVPVNYTALYNGTPLVVGTAVGPWVVSTRTTNANGRVRIVLTHPSLTIAAGATSALTTFPRVDLPLTAGAQGAPIPGVLGQSARFRIGSTSLGSNVYAADAYYPGLGDEAA